jgi:hypothetical protein
MTSPKPSHSPTSHITTTQPIPASQPTTCIVPRPAPSRLSPLSPLYLTHLTHLKRRLSAQHTAAAAMPYHAIPRHASCAHNHHNWPPTLPCPVHPTLPTSTAHKSTASHADAPAHPVRRHIHPLTPSNAATSTQASTSQRARSIPINAPTQHPTHPVSEHGLMKPHHIRPPRPCPCHTMPCHAMPCLVTPRPPRRAKQPKAKPSCRVRIARSPSKPADGASTSESESKCCTMCNLTFFAIVASSHQPPTRDDCDHVVAHSCLAPRSRR